MYIPKHFKIEDQEQIEAKFKFNQNKPSEDIAGVIEGLKSSGASDVAEFMTRVTR